MPPALLIRFKLALQVNYSGSSPHFLQSTAAVMAYLGYKMESEELRRATKEGWRVRFMGKVLLCRVFEINVSFTKQFTYCIREVK